MSLLLNNEQEDVLVDAMMHPKDHPYHNLFLEDMDSLHRVFFAKLAENPENKDFFSLVDVYMMFSDVRDCIDKGKPKGMERSPKGCLLSIPFEKCLDKPYLQSVQKDTAKWMGEVYNHLQWTLNIPSCEIILKIPSKELYSCYANYKQTPLEEICSFFKREYFEKNTISKSELSIKSEFLVMDKEEREDSQL